ncbi:unnamed protein product [Dibothriocephalus latus]|uniref:Uncharacterized protein n=1 Tax=Dibothriocephalus latus TaxID=60516 RepID=A0A3P7P1Q2_DIBLA|nr:unnamed protein product [Dibothriocephalus latus]
MKGNQGLHRRLRGAEVAATGTGAAVAGVRDALPRNPLNAPIASVGDFEEVNMRLIGPLYRQTAVSLYDLRFIRNSSINIIRSIASSLTTMNPFNDNRTSPSDEMGALLGNTFHEAFKPDPVPLIPIPVSRNPPVFP